MLGQFVELMRIVVFQVERRRRRSGLNLRLRLGNPVTARIHRIFRTVARGLNSGWQKISHDGS
jgi:hypothetical protein